MRFTRMRLLRLSPPLRLSPAVCSNGTEAMDKAIQTAINFQRALVRLGTTILERKTIGVTRNFRLVKVDGDADAVFFQQPMAATRLASFIMQICNVRAPGPGRPHPGPLACPCARVLTSAGHTGRAAGPCRSFARTTAPRKSRRWSYRS